MCQAVVSRLENILALTKPISVSFYSCMTYVWYVQIFAPQWFLHMYITMSWPSRHRIFPALYTPSSQYIPAQRRPYSNSYYSTLVFVVLEWNLMCSFVPCIFCLPAFFVKFAHMIACNSNLLFYGSNNSPSKIKYLICSFIYCLIFMLGNYKWCCSKHSHIIMAFDGHKHSLLLGIYLGMEFLGLW